MSSQSTIVFSGRDDSSHLKSYPSDIPKTEEEKLIHKLNLETFSSRRFSCVDSNLVYILFASKRRERHKKGHSSNTWRPSSITPHNLTKDQALEAAQILQSIASNAQKLRSQCEQAAMALTERFPASFKREDQRVIVQLVKTFHL